VPSRPRRGPHSGWPSHAGRTPVRAAVRPSAGIRLAICRGAGRLSEREPGRRQIRGRAQYPAGRVGWLGARPEPSHFVSGQIAAAGTVRLTRSGGPPKTCRGARGGSGLPGHASGFDFGRGPEIGPGHPAPTYMVKTMTHRRGPAPTHRHRDPAKLWRTCVPPRSASGGRHPVGMQQAPAPQGRLTSWQPLGPGYPHG
jgi:hypothetical protein